MLSRHNVIARNLCPSPFSTSPPVLAQRAAIVFPPRFKVTLIRLESITDVQINHTHTHTHTQVEVAPAERKVSVPISYISLTENATIMECQLYTAAATSQGAPPPPPPPPPPR